MSKFVTLDTKQLKVGELERLRRKHIDRYERPLDAAIRLSDVVAFKSVLKQTCCETASFCYNYRREAQWGLLRESKPSFSACFRYGRQFDIPSRSREEGDIQHLPDIEEYQLIVLDRAMERSEARLVDMLLKCEINVRRKYPLAPPGFAYHGTILHTAARYSTPEVCSLLLERGADLFQETTRHESPLDFAIDGMNKSVIDMLCPNSTFVERRDSEGRTPLLRHCTPFLSYAISFRRDRNLALEVAKQLVRLGADVKARDNQERSALHGAACQLNVALVKWLVDMGVQPDEEDAQGMTPFRFFAHAEHLTTRGDDPNRLREQIEETYKYLRRHTSDEQLNVVFSRPGDCQCVSICHWRRSHPPLEDRQTLLSTALGAENWILANLLFRDGAECPAEKINNYKWVTSHLNTAYRKGQSATFAHLLHSVAPENRCGLFVVDGFFIEGNVMNHGNVRSLGPDDGYAAILAAMSESGMRAQPAALQKALECRAPNPIVRALTTFNSMLDLAEYANGSHDILLTAALSGHHENFLCVLSHIRSLHVRPWWLDEVHETRFDSLEIVAECLATVLSGDSAMEARDKRGMTPLLRATLSNNAVMVRALLQHGADIDAQEPVASWNALLLAVKRGWVDVVDVLLEFGSDPNVRPVHYLEEYPCSVSISRDAWNGTPLILAVDKARDIGKHDIVLALLSHGADVNARATTSQYIGSDRRLGDTALATAVERVSDERSYAHQAHFSASRIRSVVHKAVGNCLPAELTDEIADLLIADITSNKQTKELVRILIEHGADPTGAANNANLRKITMFSGGYEALWDNHLRPGIEDGKGMIYEFDATL